MKICPYCAEEIQEEAIVCRFCGRDIDKIIPSDSKRNYSQPIIVKSTINQIPSYSYIIGYAFLLEFFTYLEFFGLPFYFSYRDGHSAFGTGVIFAIAFYIIFRASIGIIGAKGKNLAKTEFTDYLLYTLLSLIPVLGIISSIQAAQYFWNKQKNKANNNTKQVLIFTIIGGVALIFIGLYLGIATYQNQPPRTLPEYPVIPTVNTFSTMPPKYYPGNGKLPCNPDYQVCLPGAPTPIPFPGTSTPHPTAPTSCTLWSEISLYDVGRIMCVWGTVRNKYIDWYDSNTNYVMYITFGSETGNFYILSYDFDFPDLKSGECIQVTSKINQLSTSPVIVITQEDNIYHCNK